MIVIDVIKDDYKFLYMWTLNGIDKNIYYINYNIFIIKNADLKNEKIHHLKHEENGGKSVELVK